MSRGVSVSNVVRLVAKDVRLQRGFLGVLLVFEAVTIGMFLLQMGQAGPLVAPMLVHGVALFGGFVISFRTMLAEEKNRALLFVKSLPVSTFEIVAAKFVVNATLVAGNTILLLLVYQALRTSGMLPAEAPPPTVAGALVGISLQVLNNAIFLTTIVVFDSEKAVWIPFPLLFVVLNVLVNLRRIADTLYLGALLTRLTTVQLVVPLVVGVAVTGLCLLSSSALSRKRVFG